MNVYQKWREQRALKRFNQLQRRYEELLMPEHEYNQSGKDLFINELKDVMVGQEKFSAALQFHCNSLYGLAQYNLKNDLPAALAGFLHAMVISDFEEPPLWNANQIFETGTSEIFYWLSRVFREQGNFSAARQYASQGIALDKSRCEFYLELVEISYAEKNFRQMLQECGDVYAIEVDYERWSSNDLDHDRLMLLRARAHGELKNYPKAIGLYDQLIADNPSSANVYKNERAELIKRRGRENSAGNE